LEEKGAAHGHGLGRATGAARRRACCTAVPTPSTSVRPATRGCTPRNAWPRATSACASARHVSAPLRCWHASPTRRPCALPTTRRCTPRTHWPGGTNACPCFRSWPPPFRLLPCLRRRQPPPPRLEKEKRRLTPGYCSARFWQ
jgi:hypothetical protein